MKTTRSPRNRGSVFLSVVLFTSVVLIIAASLIGLSLTERRMNNRMAYLLEANNSAEALAEYGFSQIRQKFETRSTFNLKPGGTDALKLPASAFWNNSNVDTASLELVGGTIKTRSSSGSSYYYVDPANPNNENDPLRGKWVWRRDVDVIAKATVRPPGGGAPLTSYAGQRISVRGAPLFAHAIFYNMDLEIFPGPEMNILGPVHANGNIYLSSQSASLNFYGQVTASGHVYHDWKHGVGGNKGSETLGNSPVRFANRDGTLVSMLQNGTWKDSRMGGTSNSADFRSYASELWQGNLLTKDHEISPYTPVAFGEYREADPYNPSVSLDDPTKAPSNSGRLIIEPPSIPTDPDASDYATRLEVEKQKYANNAGIYVKVVPPANPGDSPVITVSSRSVGNLGTVKSLTLPSLNPIITYRPYSDDVTEVKVTKTRKKIGNTWELTTTTTTTQSNTTNFGTTSNATVNTEVTTSATQPSTSGSTTTTGTVNSGLYDRRRQTGVSLVDIDMDALRKAVANLSGTSTKLSNGSTYTPAGSDAIGNLSGSDWTGIVYVEVAGGPTTDPLTGATIAGSSSQANSTAVRIINGKGQVPSYGTANEGLTIATNAPMYVQGNYNADGTTSTATATHSARVPEAGEVPAALVADAITLLSENFNLANTRTVNKPSSTGTVEISAALLMGITPTNPALGTKGESSGGAHNFPRFLESWGTTFIRGSLVALFESRIAKEPWNTDYYSPPQRNWGFNDLFRQGRYPPGTPRVMSYRRVDFTDMSATEYSTTKNGFAW